MRVAFLFRRMTPPRRYECHSTCTAGVAIRVHVSPRPPVCVGQGAIGIGQICTGHRGRAIRDCWRIVGQVGQNHYELVLVSILLDTNLRGNTKPLGHVARPPRAPEAHCSPRRAPPLLPVHTLVSSSKRRLFIHLSMAHAAARHLMLPRVAAAAARRGAGATSASVASSSFSSSTTSVALLTRGRGGTTFVSLSALAPPTAASASTTYIIGGRRGVAWMSSSSSSSLSALSTATSSSSSSEVEKGTPPAWEFRLLYDGDCPLCMKEVTFLRDQDQGRGKIDLVDISAVRALCPFSSRL